MARDYSGRERRQFKRVRVTFIVIYRVDAPVSVRMMVGNKEVHAIMQDLSEGGIALLTSQRIPVSSALSIEFILFNDTAVSDEDRVRPMYMDGEVRYCLVEKEKETYRLGIRFSNLVEADRNAIADFVKMAVAI